ncbi:hypothetical protein BT96DRAFT_941398 [Gymnopus androsaceus JB14]|uniref:Uncharacterized protein n=1 Tax=Gymnopus androsaceus JB14 TaxID=1447944 RepID=A0A6A4HEI8_9AGAR|nr:hypothetical protein BT96DRAFT_941398 [Gymnopus androsaceus JB14]
MSSPKPPTVTPTPYLAGILLNTRQIQLIAENTLSAEDISLANYNDHGIDYAWAMNRHFHEALVHRVVICPPRNAKPSDKDLRFYAHSVVPSFDGKPPQLYAGDFGYDFFRELLEGLPEEVRKEFLGARMGVVRWPRYFREPEWIREDMYNAIEKMQAQHKLDGDSEDDTT